MFKFLSDGGPIFTAPMTFLLFFILVLAVRYFIRLQNGAFPDISAANRSLDYVRYLGVLTMTVGILGQIVGLYSAFVAIAEWGGIKPDMLAAGLRVSSITTLYGMTIFVIAYVVWLILRAMTGNKLAN
ncbi:MAG: MotA/TolQ/ExbB proton channel family protein [Bacteroidota bacterium]